MQHDYSMPTLAGPRSRVKLAYRSTERVYDLRFVPGSVHEDQLSDARALKWSGGSVRLMRFSNPVS